MFTKYLSGHVKDAPCCTCFISQHLETTRVATDRGQHIFQNEPLNYDFMESIIQRYYIDLYANVLKSLLWIKHTPKEYVEVPLSLTSKIKFGSWYLSIDRHMHYRSNCIVLNTHNSSTILIHWILTTLTCPILQTRKTGQRGSLVQNHVDGKW